MEYKDKTLTCKDCGEQFTFTAGEQEFYAEKGFQNEPTRCKECRIKNKSNRNFRSGSQFSGNRPHRDNKDNK
jgi:hypothetical protein